MQVDLMARPQTKWVSKILCTVVKIVSVVEVKIGTEKSVSGVNHKQMYWSAYIKRFKWPNSK